MYRSIVILMLEWGAVGKNSSFFKFPFLSLFEPHDKQRDLLFKKTKAMRFLVYFMWKIRLRDISKTQFIVFYSWYIMSVKHIRTSSLIGFWIFCGFRFVDFQLTSICSFLRFQFESLSLQQFCLRVFHIPLCKKTTVETAQERASAFFRFCRTILRRILC